MKDVHTEHCQTRRCEYGEENFCSVYLGYEKPSFPDEYHCEINQAEFLQRQEKAKERNWVEDYD